MPSLRVRSAVKRILGSNLAWDVMGPLVRPPGVIVMMFHRVLRAGDERPGISIDRFAELMRWVRHHCDPIAPEVLAERARHPRRRRPAVLVTFDDGYRDYHDLAYPVLRELGIPATVFLVTSLVDGGGTLWTDRVQTAAELTQRTSARLSPDLPESPLPDAAARAAFGRKARQFLKTLPDAERLVLTERLLDELGVPAPTGRDFMTWDEVRATMDLTRYGGHTHTHPILSRLTPERATEEIRTCRDRISHETGMAPWLFAYPNGQPSDYTGETQRILREHGFSVAFSTSRGVAGPATDWMAVPRLAGEENLTTAVYSLRQLPILFARR